MLGEGGLRAFEFGDLGFEGGEFGFQRLEDLGADFALLGFDAALFLAVDAGDGLAGRTVSGRAVPSVVELGDALFRGFVLGGFFEVVGDVAGVEDAVARRGGIRGSW